MLWLNYPNNPTGAVADLEFFERAVAFARKYDVAILHDGPYSEVAFDGYQPVSFLQADGAKDVGDRVPLAVEVVQHDGLADRHGGGQRARSSMR